MKQTIPKVAQNKFLNKKVKNKAKKIYKRKT